MWFYIIVPGLSSMFFSSLGFYVGEKLSKKKEIKKQQVKSKHPYR